MAPEKPDLASELLGADGPFAGLLDAFAPRAEQQALADAIDKAMASGGTLVAEAGTGIGKTLSYLVPVVTSGLRTIISTGTKNLQDQLYFKDLPLVLKALGGGVSTALLKGRSNYLCLYRMERARESGELPSRAAVAELEDVYAWSAATEDGDLSLASVISDDSGLWPFVTSTTDNCLGSECPRYEHCHVLLARKKAQQADLVVVNHHLLFADMAIKQSGFGEVLPGAEAFIVDEAHQAPEIASRFFSASLSARKLNDLCRDVMAEASKLSGGMPTVREPVEACKQAMKELQATMDEHLPERGSWQRLLERSEIRGGMQKLDQAIADLVPALKALESSSNGMAACTSRCEELQFMMDRLDAVAGASEVRWFERRGRGFGLNITPLNIAELFSDFRMQVDAAWIFTSATLSVNGAFEHFTQQMGLSDADLLRVESPFDYPNKALMWLPEGLPEPRQPEFTETMLETVTPALAASGGRAFMLFTSHRALQQGAEWLAKRLDYPLFVQGEAPRSLLLERFRRSGNGVLLGTASFWSGVDVMGEALSLVVIDKLPFAAPDDPVMEARSEALRQDGGNPFMQLYLPQAVITLKQGAGRLIRDVGDRGVLVICDPRVSTKGYGAAFLDSLPPMRRTTELAEVVRFFEHETTGD
ncbi:MAG: ATP-dependent DNA helicase [Xanthomonadales bacterium]|nr:ATP-dependent DNA helicase [Xanthomonadales bacterium]NNL94100.1 ATP-dependent DNA helicase [Xanthomonadales bacterium]